MWNTALIYNFISIYLLLHLVGPLMTRMYMLAVTFLEGINTVYSQFCNYEVASNLLLVHCISPAPRSISLNIISLSIYVFFSLSLSLRWLADWLSGACVPVFRTDWALWPAPLSPVWKGTAGFQTVFPGQTAASRRKPSGPFYACSASPVIRLGAGTRPASASLQELGSSGLESQYPKINKQNKWIKTTKQMQTWKNVRTTIFTWTTQWFKVWSWIMAHG